LAVVAPAAGLDLVSEHDLRSGIVHPRLEPESAALPRIRDRPARETPRDVDDVVLRVAAVDAERVQLHQLAAVVLVESALRALRVRGRLAGARMRRKESGPPHAGPAERRPESVAGLQALAWGARLH